MGYWNRHGISEAARQGDQPRFGMLKISGGTMQDVLDRLARAKTVMAQLLERL